MGFIVGVLIWFLLWPCRVARNPRATNSKKKFAEESSESAEWINRVLDNTLSQHNIEGICAKVVQKSFQESFTEDREGRIRKVQVSEVKIARKPPVFHDVQTLVDENSRVVSNMSIEYDADFEIKCDLDLAFPVIGVKTVGTLVKVKTVKGFLTITVPYEKGPIIIQLRKGTDVECDASILYGANEIGTEALGPVWTGVRSAVIGAVRMMKLKINFPGEELESEEDPEVVERGVGLELDDDELRAAEVRAREMRLKAEAEAKKKAEEEAKKKAEEEARRKAEEARKKAEEEARRKAEEEAKKKAEEARKKAEEEARRKAEEEARKKAEEEARRKAEEEARRKAEEEARKKAEEEAKKKAEEEARRKAEEEARKKAEEEAKKKAEEEARRKAEEEARKKAEEEARKKAEEEEARRKEEEERRKAEEMLKMVEMMAADGEDEVVDCSVGQRSFAKTVKAEGSDSTQSSTESGQGAVTVQRTVVVSGEPQITTIVQQGEPQVIQRTVVVSGGGDNALALGGQVNVQGQLVVGGQAPTTSTQIVVGSDGSTTQIDTANMAAFAAHQQTMTAHHVQEVDGGRLEVNATATVTRAVAVQQTVVTTTTTTTEVVEE